MTEGLTVSEVASTLYISKQSIRDLLQVDRLSTRLRHAFLGEALSLEQVRAFATLPNHAAQDTLLDQLGPFAEDTDILKAISNGVSVLNLTQDNVIILPSREQHSEALAYAA